MQSKETKIVLFVLFFACYIMISGASFSICKCPKSVHPICGSDGVTYGSMCLLECVSRAPGGIEFLRAEHIGFCKLNPRGGRLDSMEPDYYGKDRFDEDSSRDFQYMDYVETPLGSMGAKPQVHETRPFATFVSQRYDGL
ncbi:uncharacterized protein LOC112904128 [Agrilus planipennis]|uniref:Uncharacterized protein LOC112904128 n=1 Tax=Agrilus planipennis TaxID=224129 RepID=A0A7F5QVT9_AGRPL|nr:uncharacterized protein LOC112904128 [Agrilus planipennis]